jgi:pimeloyl-ACP methyl ester carboxylesterase
MQSPPRHGRLKGGLALSAALALVALWARQSAKAAERRFPPAGKFIEVDGVRLHYIEQGSGPAVVLLHGNGTGAADFLGCGLIETLASRYRVIAFDRPGFGYSERPRGRQWTPKAQAMLLSRACTALGIERPVVQGHTFGTLVAVALALDAEMPLRGLVLASGYYFPSFRLDAWMLSAPAIPLLGDVMRYTLSPLLGRLMLPGMLRRFFAPRKVDSRFKLAVPPPVMLRPWQLKASAEESGILVPAVTELAPRYKDIPVPVEILAGADDKPFKPGNHSVRLHHLIPGSRLQLVPGVGHMLHYGRIAEIVEAVDRITQAAIVPGASSTRSAG